MMCSVKTKVSVMILSILLIVTMFILVQADSSFISIQEMQDNIPSTWTENLKGGKKNFDCTIDASIIVPEVECFPILLVDYQGIIPGIEDSGYYVDENTEKVAVVKTTSKDVIANVDFSREIVLREDSLGEDIVCQAEKKARTIINKVLKMEGVELEKTGVVEKQVASSAYKNTTVVFTPVYCGIPYLYLPHSYNGIKNYITPPNNIIYAFWREDIDYDGACISIPQLVGEYLPDVPLLPFEQIQDVIRQRIQEGYVQSICEIRLGYICGNDPNRPGENFYLTPAWVVCGVMNTEPNLPFYPDNYRSEWRYESPLVINAQTGEIIDVTSRSKETFDAHILTWDDVKK